MTEKEIRADERSRCARISYAQATSAPKQYAQACYDVAETIKRNGIRDEDLDSCIPKHWGTLSEEEVKAASDLREKALAKLSQAERAALNL
jgi:hypothetical protein